MPSFLVLGIYLLLSDDGERAGWNRFLYGVSVKDEGGNYGVSILTNMTWRLLFPNGDIKAEMVSPPWNNFLRSLLRFLRFIVVRSGHDKGLGRISFRSIFPILWWQKKEGRHQKEEVSQLRLHECWPSFVGYLFSGLLPSVCLCGHLYCKASYRFGFKICNFLRRGYNLDKKKVWKQRFASLLKSNNVVFVRASFERVIFSSDFIGFLQSVHMGPADQLN